MTLVRSKGGGERCDLIVVPCRQWCDGGAGRIVQPGDGNEAEPPHIVMVTQSPTMDEAS